MSQQNKTVTDKRGRDWEQFVDISYFHMICVRPTGDKNFNSELSFHFNTLKDANGFMELLEKAS